jgi:hypothetical protein
MRIACGMASGMAMRRAPESPWMRRIRQWAQFQEGRKVAPPSVDTTTPSAVAAHS